MRATSDKTSKVLLSVAFGRSTKEVRAQQGPKKWEEACEKPLSIQEFCEILILLFKCFYFGTESQILTNIIVKKKQYSLETKPRQGQDSLTALLFLLAFQVALLSNISVSLQYSVSLLLSFNLPNYYLLGIMDQSSLTTNNPSFPETCAFCLENKGVEILETNKTP